MSSLSAGKAEEEARKKEQDRRDRNGQTYIPIYDSLKESLTPRNNSSVRTDQQGFTDYSQQPLLSRVANVENPAQQFYDSSADAWRAPLSRVPAANQPAGAATV